MFHAAIPVPDHHDHPVRHRLTVKIGKRPLTADVTLPGPDRLSTQPPLLALHGISRNAGALRRVFAPLCAAQGRVLITPRFSNADWRHFQTIGRHRADRALLALLDQVHLLGLADVSRVSIFGYSGGAQLAHRFAMLYPNRVAALHVAAAGWYCLPNSSLPFPMGLGAGDGCTPLDVTLLAQSQLPAFLKLPLRVYVGAEDIERDPALRKHPTIDAVQGLHRRSRALRYAKAFRDAGQARSISPDVTFTQLPGCAHSFAACVRAGLAALVCENGSPQKGTRQ